MPDQQVIRFLIPENWRDLTTLDDRIALQDWLMGDAVPLRAMKDLLAKFVCDEHNRLVGEKEGRKILGTLRGEQAIVNAFTQFMDAFTRAIVPPQNGNG